MSPDPALRDVNPDIFWGHEDSEEPQFNPDESGNKAVNNTLRNPG
jgi:hypothetical protein